MNYSKKNRLFSVAALFIILLTFVFGFESVYSISRVRSLSDTISTSWPDTGAIHKVEFTASSLIPAGGKVVVTPQSISDDPFNIEAGLSYEHVTFWLNGEEQELAESPDSDLSGVYVEPGFEGRVEINLADNLTIEPDDKVTIKIGNGDRKIINPSEEGTYGVKINTFNAEGDLLDRGNTLIAIIKPIHVGTSPAPQVITEEAVVLGREEAVLKGELFSLGPISSVDVFFEYRIKELEGEDLGYTQEEGHWTETSKKTRTAPDNYSQDISELEPGTTYEFRAAVQWVDSSTKRAHGLIKEFTTEKVDSEDDGQEDNEPGEEPGDPDNEQGEGEDEPGDPDPPPPGSNTDDPGEPANPPPEDLPDPPPYMVFTGTSFLNSEITLVKENQQIDTTQVDGEGNFRFEIDEPSEETFDFMLIRKDEEGGNVSQISFTAEGNPERMILISGNVFPPTIEADGNQVTEDNPVTVSGRAAPESVVEVRFSGEDKKITRETTAGSNGDWSMSVEKQRFAEGRYNLQARMVVSGQRSSYTDSITLSVGETGATSSDLNNDGAVNLSDFSILMHYWGTSAAEGDINNDGTVDLTDFSIMMNYWTG